MKRRIVQWGQLRLVNSQEEASCMHIVSISKKKCWEFPYVCFHEWEVQYIVLHTISINTATALIYLNISSQDTGCSGGWQKVLPVHWARTVLQCHAHGPPHPLHHDQVSAWVVLQGAKVHYYCVLEAPLQLSWGKGLAWQVPIFPVYTISPCIL